MQNISREYLLLFNTLTDAEKTLADLRERLISAQQMAEEMFITQSEIREAEEIA